MNHATPARSLPLSACPPEDLAQLDGVLCDLDGTLTRNGRLPAACYARLEQLSEAGLRVFIITGRPAGWCDLIVRLWPVDGVVGENGAFHFRRGARGIDRVWTQSAQTRAANTAALEAALDAALAATPGSAPAADNPWRDVDRALDFAEDVGPLPLSAAETARAAFEAHGATAKVSSIHVNAWIGEHTKLGAALDLLASIGVATPEAAAARFAYIGDSPNDAPMFAALTHTVGVAGVAAFDLPPDDQPRYITEGDEADGFIEFADAVLAARAAS